MDKMTEQDGKSLDIVNENLEMLKNIYPEAFIEDGVDFEVLRQLLGEAVVDSEEKYGLNWHGKKKARQIALTPSMGTLRPCPEESVDWDTTRNLFIEGDNLEVLKLLQKSYANKVKMIFIDPPYNTGKEFIYPDHFQDNLDTYLRYTGLKDDQGNKISSVADRKNTVDSARYHTNWLNMMYPRLKLARGLLREDGVLFVSIDDHELHTLESLLIELWGEENGLIPFIWSLPRGINAGHVSRAHEYILGFAKNKESLSLFRKQGETEFSIDRCNKKVDRRHPATKITFPAGIRYEGEDQVLTGEITGSEHVEIIDELCFQNGKLAKEVTLKAGWTMKNMILKWLDGKPVLDTKGQEIVDFFFRGNGKLYSKKRTLFESPKSVLSDVPDTQSARKEIAELLGNQDIFSYPKPSGLVEKLVDLVTSNDEIIMDFFAGSCSSAHAVLAAEHRERLNRRWVMVQLPEKLDPNDSDQQAAIAFCKTNTLTPNIAEIGKERIRRIIAKIKKEHPDFEGDLGFKVFKLDSSNIRAWNPERDNLEQTLIDHMEHLIEDRCEEDVLYELLLKRGVDLTVPIKEKALIGKTIFCIGYGVLFACLNTTISLEDVETLAQGIINWHKELDPAGDTHVVFRDSAFANDISKTNMTAILEQHGIAHVRSL